MAEFDGFCVGDFLMVVHGLTDCWCPRCSFEV